MSRKDRARLGASAARYIADALDQEKAVTRRRLRVLATWLDAVDDGLISVDQAIGMMEAR